MSTSAANTLVIGHIGTMDPQRPTAAAMAVVDGRIAAIGTREEAAAACGSNFSVLAYEGGAILPGSSTRITTCSGRRSSSGR